MSAILFETFVYAEYEPSNKTEFGEHFKLLALLL